MERVYVAIDLKSFYASVECVERGLDPLTAKLVVADESRTEKTICLAVSPALKALGISGRARLFEVLQKIPRSEFIVAPPRMKKYMEISTKIYGIYASFVAPEDIHVYSVDEVFMDVTAYLKNYKMTAHELTLTIIRKVLLETGITATAGIGSNLYLAKIAMDVEAKHMKPDKDGVRIAELDERSYREKLWNHAPITDFWRVGPGYARRLLKYGILTMGDLARFSLAGADLLYKEFGVNAELLIDHAWGYEPVTMSDIKNYQSDNHSVSSGQVLSEPYDFQKARLIVAEMADELVLDLVRKGLVTDQIVLTVGYDTVSARNYKGELVCDRYGRKIPKHAHGTINLVDFTVSTKNILAKTLELFDRIVDPELKVRRMYVVANHVKVDDGRKELRQLDIFTDYGQQLRDSAKEKRRQKAILDIKSRYGKNAILRGMNFEEGATMRKRNEQVGGHKA
ncbi:Y-family DNA polymerase [Candidatus Saccharibacteria bacterium]|nr:Y-family DNA polymerase [Candidatus Saccharibacteria bacterium]